MNFVQRQIYKLKKHRPLAIISGLGVVFAAVGYAWFFAKLRASGSTVVMHFNNVEGINQYGSFTQLAWLGGFGMVLTCINLVLTMEIAERDMILGRLAAGINIFIGVLLFIAFAAIIGAN
ncbi:MAG: hypothetical protein V1856_02005 [Candidatus Liptonbacteria bacterium]